MTLIDITIGPVQGFVAQSRRTRDLWGSSYLLSFLSAHAMVGAQQAGRLERPRMDGDQLLLHVAGDVEGQTPQIGSIPNHFVVAADGDVVEVVRRATKAFECAWKKVSDVVWNRFVAHAAGHGRDTREIWNRQVTGFWEFQWTEGEQLRRRKHWRTHRLPDERGDKCTVIHDLQELSGYVGAARGQRQRQLDFWAQVRSPLGKLDLREDEQLSAIALIKRLYPKVSREALGWQVETTRWPSSVYVGAAPWIAELTSAAGEPAAAYAHAVKKRCPDAFAHRPPPIATIQDSRHLLARMDANYLHRGFVADPRLCPLTSDAPPGAGEVERADAQQQREALLQALEQLHKAAGADQPPSGNGGGPPVFYALLLADGDRLGDVVKTLGAETVGEALTLFTTLVQEEVAKHHGVTVYAGGDDVLALLPVDGALRCAAALAQQYTECFALAGGTPATLSAAVVFAHMRLPHSRVLAEARRLLKYVAKRGNGRDSLAAAVLKRGGLHCEWSSAWFRPVEAASAGERDAVVLIEALAAGLKDAETEVGMSSSLLFRLRETLSLLCGWPHWEPGCWGWVPAQVELETFLRAEIAPSLERRCDDLNSIGGDAPADAHKAETAALAASVKALLLPARNSDDHAAMAESEQPAGVEVGLDGLLLARFIAQGGREED